MALRRWQCCRWHSWMCLLSLLLCWSTVIEQASLAQADVVDDRKGKQVISLQCPSAIRNAPLVVDEVALVCDSPEAWGEERNSGNNEDDNEDDNRSSQDDDAEDPYKDAIVCLPGDYAKLAINFRLLPKNSFDSGILLSFQASFYGYSKRIHTKTSLCNFRSLMYHSEAGDHSSDVNVYRYGASCPLVAGSYQLYTTFRVPQFLRDQDLQFTPDVSIQFADGGDGHLLGCATTGTIAMLDLAKRRQSKGSWLLGGALLLFLTTFSLCLITHGRHRSKSRRGGPGSVGEAGGMPSSVAGSNYSVSGASTNSTQVVRRYHYHRTTRNGTVLAPDEQVPDDKSLGTTTSIMTPLSHGSAREIQMIDQTSRSFDSAMMGSTVGTLSVPGTPARPSPQRPPKTTLI